MILLAYFLLFFIYSFIGFILETIFAFITRGVIENRKTMRFLPLCPVYGIGALMLDIILSPFINYPIICIVGGVIIGTVAEYLYGFLCRALFQVDLWNYSELKHNKSGLIALPFCVIWCVLSSVYIYTIKPHTDIIIYNFPFSIAVFLLTLFISDMIYTVFLLIKIRNGASIEILACPIINKTKG